MSGSFRVRWLLQGIFWTRSVLSLNYIASWSLLSSSDDLLLQIGSLDALFAVDVPAHFWLCLSKHQKTSQCTFLPEKKSNTFSSFSNAKLKHLPTHPSHENGLLGKKCVLPQKQRPSRQLKSRDKDVHRCYRKLGTTAASLWNFKNLKAEVFPGFSRAALPEKLSST